MAETYWIHRTTLLPMFVNLKCKENGLPPILTVEDCMEIIQEMKSNYDRKRVPDKNFEE